MVCPCKASKGNGDMLTPYFEPNKTGAQLLTLPNCKIINMYCFKPLFGLNNLVWQ